MPDRGAPVETAGGRRRLPRPQHPGGEDAVEQGLHQGRVEEARTLLALEADAERLLKRRAHRRERRRVARRLNPREAVAGIGGEQPGQILRLGEGRPVRQRAGEVFTEAGAGRPAGEGARPFQHPDECRLALGHTVRLERRLSTGRVRADEREFAKVRHQHQAVAAPVPAHLLAHRPRAGVVVWRLHLDHPAFRDLPLARSALLHLLRRVEPEVRMARALIGRLHHAEHLGFQSRTDGVEQLRERPVARPLAGRAARRAQSPELGEPGLHRRRQLRARSRHGLRCRRMRHGAQVLPRARGGAERFLGVERKLRDVEFTCEVPTRFDEAAPNWIMPAASAVRATPACRVVHRRSRAHGHRVPSPD